MNELTGSQYHSLVEGSTTESVTTSDETVENQNEFVLEKYLEEFIVSNFNAIFKGRPSDQVVGQILRYMGWVKQNLCNDDQAVKGLVICRDPDPKLSYALTMINNVDVRYYGVSFTLRDTP